MAAPIKCRFCGEEKDTFSELKKHVKYNHRDEHAKIQASLPEFAPKAMNDAPAVSLERAREYRRNLGYGTGSSGAEQRTDDEE